MTKDQFWQTIDQVNQGAPYPDQEAHMEAMCEVLLTHSKEDIIDWHQILLRYSGAAYRDDLWAASAALGAHYTDDGFIDFRSWLISQGKEVYMNAMRDPDSLADVPREGEKLNFESFGYAGSYAYDRKLHQEGIRRGVDIYKAKLSAETVRDIQAELPQRPDIGPDWSVRQLPDLFPRICARMEHGQSMTMEG